MQQRSPSKPSLTEALPQVKGRGPDAPLAHRQGSAGGILDKPLFYKHVPIGCNCRGTKSRRAYMPTTWLYLTFMVLSYNKYTFDPLI